MELDRSHFATVTADGLQIGYLEAGPADGPLAICLHGFPDSPTTWRHLLPELAAQGYRAVAPAMRGYAPTGIGAEGGYQVARLGLDVIALHDALGGDDRAVVVGHDWGAAATYAAINLAPERFRRAVASAVPPLAAFAGAMLTYEQQRRSWYMFFFQTGLAELCVPMDDFAFLDRLWQDWSPGYDAQVELAATKAALATPERTVAALSYYRAAFNPALTDPALSAAQAQTAAPTVVETLYLHGRQDGCIDLGGIGDPLALLAPGSQFEVIDDAGHFAHLERPEYVNGLILDWLGPAQGSR